MMRAPSRKLRPRPATPILLLWVRIRPGDDPSGDFVECAEVAMDPKASLRVGAAKPKRDVPKDRMLIVADGRMAVADGRMAVG